MEKSNINKIQKNFLIKLHPLYYNKKSIKLNHEALNNNNHQLNYKINFNMLYLFLINYILLYSFFL